jgi:hypothetical protein
MEVPYAMQAYNQWMGGVDTSNQKLKLNSTTKAVRYKKWPTKIVEYATSLNSSNGHIQFQVQ